MKVAILDVRKGVKRDATKSYTVSYRNLVVLKEEFNADLFVNASEISHDDNYDVIVCGFGSTSCEKDRSTDFLVRNKKAKIFWLVGEYEQSTFAPLFYSQREFSVIKNFEHTIKNKKCTSQHFININSLLAQKQRPETDKKYGCVYYGRWRPDRLKYYQQYMGSNVYLSTHSKNIKMFHHNGCNPKLIQPMSWTPYRETLNLFKSSLYIEDEFTHTHYNCLANRYYEAIMCGVVPLFDESCRNTVKQSGIIDTEWHFVKSGKDIASKIKGIDQEVMARLGMWNDDAIKEMGETLNSIRDLFANA
ncbi:MAG: hypothetical protein KAR07_02420 [Spirochaetes bacterium]|nr:hypothetical protein [Spirochaetota bacterium]